MERQADLKVEIVIPFLIVVDSCCHFKTSYFHTRTWSTFTSRTKLYFVHGGSKWGYRLQNVVELIFTKFTLVCFHDCNKLLDEKAVK